MTLFLVFYKLAVAVSWMTIVELTPASQRPFIGDTAGNSEFELTLGYNTAQLTLPVK